MVQSIIQTAFHAGEWAPTLNARVDLAKYHSAAALLENYFVDYRGGASSRMGTKWLLQAKDSDNPVRLIPFQASQNVGYILEFGQGYIRFYTQGAPVLETAIALTAATAAAPAVFTKTAHGLQDGDWVFTSGFAGGTWATLNNRYLIVTGATANDFSLTDLFGASISGVGLGVWTAGSVQRVYTLASPYQAADLALLKFTQNVSQMYLSHPDYSTYVLTLISAANWTITQVPFGATIAAPTGVSVATTLAAGTVNYAYVVTAVDANGQESSASSSAALASRQDLRTTAGTNRITWNAVTGATRYNVYKAILSYTNAVPTGAVYGFIGDATGTTFDDSNIAADFTETPPIPQNPFFGASVESVAVTAPGSYTTLPSVTIAAPSSGQQATASAILQVQGTPVKAADQTNNWVVGDIVYLIDTSLPVRHYATAVVASVAAGFITAFQPITYPGSWAGSWTVGTAPTTVTGWNSLSSSTKSVLVTIAWGVGIVNVINGGTGYLSAPSVTFSAGAATATAVLSAQGGNPSVPQFAYQRLWLMGPTNSPQQFNASKPGLYTNFDISIPAQPDDAIQGTITSGILNEIKAAVPMPSGLIVFATGAAWQIYGAGAGQAPSAIDVTAQSQAYNGISDVPPIVANFDILYVQSKGASVRDLSYNFYTNIYTGTDISVLSSHLFYGKAVVEWSWAEEPFKVAWAIRNDGVMLSLTFLKEQDLIGWTHHVTNGDWKSVASVQENVGAARVDAVYLVVERTIGATTVKYIERMADRFFTNYTDAWCVDSGLQYDGAPATTFTGFEHLAGKNIVGLADGIPFTATVSASGSFTLVTAASLVTAGLGYNCDLQTLQIDIGNPTVQGKMKAIPSVTVRVANTLGLSIGSTFSTLVAMKDLQLGQVGSASNQRVTDLVTGDAKTVLDVRYTVPGQYCIRQSLPYPATILGVIPELSVGDSEKPARS